MKLAALQRKSRRQVSVKRRFDDSAMAPATSAVLTRKYVPTAPTTGFACGSVAIGNDPPSHT
jgi:hypothetical protein